MRKLLSIFIAVTLISIGTFAQDKFQNWPEMNKFHATLSETFHPAEEGDLEPIKTRSHELTGNAKMINANPLPDVYNNEEIQKTLKRLYKETDKLNAIVVRQEQSFTIMKQFTIVHDTFHELMGMCKEQKN